MKELGLSLNDINNLSIKKVRDYLIIIDEVHKMEEKQIQAAQK